MNRSSSGGASIIGSPHFGGRTRGWLMQLVLAFAVLMFNGVFANQAMAAAPKAGSVIGNQATATYKDSGGVDRSTTSNLVETTITQIAGVDVKDPRDQNAAPGQIAYLPHTIQNLGNGDDIFNLTTVQVPGGGYNFSNIVIYADDNGDGVPDNNTPLTSIQLKAAGDPNGLDKKNVVIAAQVPGSATSGQSSQLTITATSQLTNTVTDSNTDKVTVVNDANVPVTKSLSVQQGPAGTEVTIQLSYRNNGSKAATALTIKDTLDARYDYTENSARWSVTPSTVLTDGGGIDNQGGIVYTFDAPTNKVTAVIDSVAPGQSGYITFKAVIKTGTAPGTVPNTAYTDYNNGTTTVTDVPSNPADFTVTPTYAVTFTDANSTKTGADTDGTVNDTVTRNAVPQGSTVDFDNVLVNNGNGPDTFDITVDRGSFPLNTTFQLLREDLTPMTDSNGNGVPDTGPVAAGATFHVIMRATLPANASSTTPVTAVKTATSVNDPTKSDTVKDTLLAINSSTVDLTNNKSIAGGATAADGMGPGPEAGAVTTNTDLLPGQSTSFVLYVNNTSSITDSYNLTYGGSVGAAPNYTLGAMPAGWSVVFHDGDANGAVITNTGNLVAGASKKVTAVVTVPANQAGASQDVYFRTQSPITGAFDVKHDAVTVKNVTDVSVTPDHSSQGIPGGNVVYAHTLSNNGNTTVAAGTLTATNSDPNWPNAGVVIYWDKNGNGQIDATDPVVTDISQVGANGTVAPLAPGDSVPLLVKVFVPAAAVNGAANTTTITATVVGDGNVTNNAAKDTTTVVIGDVKLEKTQALQPKCTGAVGTYTSAKIDAAPGDCLVYRITMTNLATSPISNANINDATPPYTTYVAPTASMTGGTTTAPADGTAGTVTGSTATVNPGAANAVTLEFKVKIQN